MKTELQQIAEFIGVDEWEVIELDSITKDELADYVKIFMFPSHYTADYLIFTNEAAYKHWLYYAGFEYIKESPEILKKNGLFIAAYNVLNDTSGRVGEYLDIIQELNPNN